MLERILLIDDSEGEALYVKRMLRNAGFGEPVFWLDSAEAAISYFNGEGRYSDRKRFPLPEVILLDLKMPGMDGYEFLKWFRAQPRFSSVVVIVLTGEMDPKMIQLAYQLGASSFLAKHSEVEEFENFVEFFRKFSRIANTMPKQNSTDASASSDSRAA